MRCKAAYSNSMSELKQTPRCEVTGLPLLISPFEPREEGSAYKEGNNYHHANSPKTDARLLSVTGKARRYSYGQEINITVHNRYTRRYAGPDLAISEEDELKEIVYSVAGIRPRHALAVRMYAEDDEVVDLTSFQYRAMCDPRMVHYQDAHHRNPNRRRHAQSVLGRAFAYYALDHEVVGSLSGATVQRFLSPKTHPERKLEIGSRIIQEAIGLSIDDLVFGHRELVKEGYAAPERVSPLRTVIGRFFTEQYFADYFDVVTERLQAAQAAGH